MHRTSGRWLLGLGLSLLSVLFWGALPITQTLALQAVDIYTLIWFCFLVSFTLLAILLVRNGELSKVQKMPSNAWLLLAISALLFVSYQFLLIQGLALTSSTNSQVLFNLGYPLLGLGGLVIFKERYTLSQWLGLAVFSFGYVMFFHEQLTNLITVQDKYIFGSFLTFLSAVVWVAYALLQKQLLASLSSRHILLIVYGISALLLTPFARVETVFNQGNFYLGALVFCVLNNLAPNFTFTESLQHLSASKVSAVLALAPIATLICCELMSLIAPGLIPKENLTVISIFGACLVVFGSAMTALGKSD